MKRMKQVLVLLLCLAVVLPLAAASADDGFSTSYTYTYDYWEDPQQSPDAYRVLTVIDTTSLGLENLDNQRLLKPQSLFVQGDMLYIVDTGNNRIIEVKRTGNAFAVTRIISQMNVPEGATIEVTDAVPEEPAPAEDAETAEETPAEETAEEAPAEATAEETPVPEVEAEAPAEDPAAEGAGEEEEAASTEPDVEIVERKAGDAIPDTFVSPYDVFVDPDGNIYVADYGNQRVTMMDKDLNWIRDYTKPQDNTFDQSLAFLPKKIVVDVAGRVYVLGQNVNKGLVKFEADGEFAGFIGANQVSVTMAEYIWKRYFQTKEQRAQTESFVPTEYENVAIDEDGFIYATTTVFSEYDLKYDKAKPVRRLNSLGGDILIKNDRFPPIGDLDWVSGGSESYGPSKLTDVTVIGNDIYVVLDRIRGRLFGYDSQGVMLWAFGTKGNVNGAFTGAVSLEHMGYDLLVLDQIENSVTVFRPTEYGMLIYNACETYLNGEYDRSADLWREVLKMNANYPLAFRGIGRAIMRQDRYEEAMEYFELAHDRENYGRAFKLYRKVWVEKNIWWIILIIAALLIIPLIIGRVMRMKWEVTAHELGKVRK